MGTRRILSEPGDRRPAKAPTAEVDQLNELGDALDGRRGESQQRIARRGVEWIGLLLAKNQDYGDSVFKQPRLVPTATVGDAILVRITDKIERLESIVLQGPMVENESFEDTIRDLGAYCLLYLARPKGVGISNDQCPMSNVQP
ncbi:hypothetical protein CMI37_14235 [Candidatus Pacearchaeota archaeon]|nr:hypothetical protein [Candidatus Pacearchaeota archaeon]|tara:strand:- start:815 stop:1246 length:432 start_codon:yes stop_codon:yes gene_type:complete